MKQLLTLLVALLLFAACKKEKIVDDYSIVRRDMSKYPVFNQEDFACLVNGGADTLTVLGLCIEDEKNISYCNGFSKRTIKPADTLKFKLSDLSNTGSQKRFTRYDTLTKITFRIWDLPYYGEGGLTYIERQLTWEKQ